MEIPEHFEPLNASPFLERIGPVYVSRRDSVPVIGVRISPHHANTLGRAHGGLLVTVADVALSRAVKEHLPPGATMATADLHVAFLEGLGQDDWLEAVPSIDRVGRALIHASCLLRSDGRDVARAMGTFAVRLG
ncbi:MAG: PaaI family thioesterase [Solirubrobacterales bacterium]|nr:PaaI family thioesterase [Solirubrobacterales bacterium]